MLFFPLRSLVLGALFSVACLSTLTSCSRKRSGNTTGPKVVRFAFREDVKSADPIQANDVISSELMGHIFEGLMQFNYLGTMDSLSPLLATQPPKILNKGKTLTFDLRSGVKFQDDPAFVGGKGREVVAQDFVFSLKRLADPSMMSPNWWMFDGVIEGLNEWRSAIEKAPADQKNVFFDKPVKGLVAESPTRLTFKLIKPYPQLLPILAMPQTAVMAREVVEKYGPDIINHPVGTGPFKLKSWVRGSKVSVVRNPSYREEHYPNTGSDEDRKEGLLQAATKTVPFVEEIQWDIIKEEQPLWLKFRSGELDRADIPKDNFIDAIDGNGKLKPELSQEGIVLHKYLSLTSWWIEFNMKDPVLGSNIKLREAIAHAFDRTRALELLFNNRGILANSPIPPSIEGGSQLPAYPYNHSVEKAKALLAQAGFPEGKGLPELTYDLRGPGTTQRQLGELLKDNLEKVGIKLSILANSFPEALEKTKTGRFQMMLGGWIADYPDPENFLQLFYGPNAAPGTNTSNFKNKEYDALYEKVRNELPSPERKKQVVKMGEILQKDIPAVFFYHQMEYKFTRKWLKNYKPHLFYMGTGKYVDLER